MAPQRPLPKTSRKSCRAELSTRGTSIPQRAVTSCCHEQGVTVSRSGIQLQRFQWFAFSGVPGEKLKVSRKSAKASHSCHAYCHGDPTAGGSALAAGTVTKIAQSVTFVSRTV